MWATLILHAYYIHIHVGIGLMLPMMMIMTIGYIFHSNQLPFYKFTSYYFELTIFFYRFNLFLLCVQPMSMVLPGVVGFKLSGKLRNGVTATDLVLTVTQMLRRHGVVGKFVEFYGITHFCILCFFIFAFAKLIPRHYCYF